MRSPPFTPSLSRGALLILALLLSCGAKEGIGGDQDYAYNDLMLVTGYTAKDACSCMFVMEQTEEYCRAWVKANPPLGRFTYDRNSKTVTSSAALLWSATAKYVDDVVGCQLQP
jgi:hypothetical protein